MNDTDIDEAVNLKAVYNEQSRLMLPDLGFWDVITLLDCLSQSRNRPLTSFDTLQYTMPVYNINPELFSGLQNQVVVLTGSHCYNTPKLDGRV